MEILVNNVNRLRDERFLLDFVNYQESWLHVLVNEVDGQNNDAEALNLSTSTSTKANKSGSNTKSKSLIKGIVFMWFIGGSPWGGGPVTGAPVSGPPIFPRF